MAEENKSIFRSVPDYDNGIDNDWLERIRAKKEAIYGKPKLEITSISAKATKDGDQELSLGLKVAKLSTKKVHLLLFDRAQADTSVLGKAITLNPIPKHLSHKR